MRNAVVTALGLVALMPSAAMANFDIYYFKNIIKDSWVFFDGPPDKCQALYNNIYLDDRNDVSGAKYGVRCKGSGCGEDGSAHGIEQLEMHFNGESEHHFTLYKDRDWQINDGSKWVANCMPYEGHTLECGIDGTRTIERRFRCLTESLNTNDLWN